ncbi:hypothetical protein PX860_06150 [Agrobacterium leguminum]|uniref:hypothetical protein n=1 Tax=Agrobacterium leguminum TaxID=2792015 RepID=UPI00272A6300|nr:hypothetical protein [Agrobacterium leguminum]WLD98072.1 hypothetical protein PX860_06150 [Agrobacterium leguminum]
MSRDSMGVGLRTVCFDAFKMRVAYFDDDIELVDILRNAIMSGDLTEAESKYVLKGLEPNKHPHLSRRKNSNGGRELIANHLRQTIYASYIKDIYEEVTEYLRVAMKLASERGLNSARLIGEHGFKVDARNLLELGNWDKVLSLVTETVFQNLEAERSTLRLLEKVASKLALDVDKNLITSALPYLEVRHFLVHTDGKVTSEFKAAHPHIKVNRERYVRLSLDFVADFRDAVVKLITDFDRAIIAADLLAPEHCRGQ